VVDEQELREAITVLAPGRGARKARDAVGLADLRAESPPESRVQVILTLARLVAVPQYTVRDADGTFVARVDLAFPSSASPGSTTALGMPRGVRTCWTGAGSTLSPPAGRSCV